jgi:hypothetical protein
VKTMLGAVILLTGSSWAQEGGSQTASCNRTCLQGFVDQYLAAMLAHASLRLPLTKTARYTENGQTLSMADGMWRVATAIGKKNLYFADPQSGQVGWRGVVEENGRKQIVALRMKIEGGKISEMESIISRPGTMDSMNRPDRLIDHPLFTEALPPSDRPTGKELITIANSYFEGLEQVTGKITPFAPDCTRMENGTVTSNNPASTNHGKLSCGDQFSLPGFSAVITKVRERRFPIVDEERGLVYAIIFFDHAGIPEVKVNITPAEPEALFDEALKAAGKVLPHRDRHRHRNRYRASGFKSR